jgi:hypothetical protein
MRNKKASESGIYTVVLEQNPNPARHAAAWEKIV